jgi:hypothetical protein
MSALAMARSLSSRVYSDKFHGVLKYAPGFAGDVGLRPVHGFDSFGSGVDEP